MTEQDIVRELENVQRLLSGQETEQAKKALARLLERHPEDDRILVTYANLAIQARQFELAVDLLGRLHRAHPRNGGIARSLSMALNNLGSQFERQNRPGKAREQFEAALRVNPGNGLADLNLGRMKQDSGEELSALAHFDKALANLGPDAEALACRGRLLLKTGQSEKALPDLTRSIELRPDDTRTLRDNAQALLRSGHEQEALDVFARLSEQAPKNIDARLARFLSLPPVYRDAEHLERSRQRYAAGLQTLKQSAEPLLSGEADLNRLSWSNFYLAYQGRDDRILQQRYGELITTAIESAAPHLLEPPVSALTGTRKRIGLVSSFFRECTVGAYFGSWVRALAAAGNEVYVYQVGPQRDRWTDELFAVATLSRYLQGDVLDFAEQVRGDRLDVAIFPELGMDGRVFTLAATRLAAVQCAGWGHPTTTGLSSIDYFLSSSAMEPGDAAKHYSEDLVLLPGIGTSYRPPPPPARAIRGDFGLPEQANLYLLPQSPFKIHPDNDVLLLDILERDPLAVLVLVHGPDQSMSKQLVERLERVANSRSMDVAGQIQVVPEQARERYLALNACCDVMLDTLHWSGGNASLDALHAHLPIVTLPGALMRGRQSAAMLRELGLDELVVDNPGAYVQLAVEVASNREYNQSLRDRIADRVVALCAQQEPLTALTEFVGKLDTRP